MFILQEKYDDAIIFNPNGHKHLFRKAKHSQRTQPGRTQNNEWRYHPAERKTPKVLNSLLAPQGLNKQVVGWAHEKRMHRQQAACETSM